jgi:hypothetical protein
MAEAPEKQGAPGMPIHQDMIVNTEIGKKGPL